MFSLSETVLVTLVNTLIHSASCRAAPVSLTLPVSFTLTAWCHFLSCGNVSKVSYWPLYTALATNGRSVHHFLSMFVDECRPDSQSKYSSFFFVAWLKKASCYDFLLFNYWMNRHLMVLHIPATWNNSSVSDNLRPLTPDHQVYKVVRIQITCKQHLSIHGWFSFYINILEKNAW